MHAFVFQEVGGIGDNQVVSVRVLRKAEFRIVGFNKPKRGVVVPCNDFVSLKVRAVARLDLQEVDVSETWHVRGELQPDHAGASADIQDFEVGLSRRVLAEGVFFCNVDRDELGGHDRLFTKVILIGLGILPRVSMIDRFFQARMCRIHKPVLAVRSCSASPRSRSLRREFTKAPRRW